MSAFGKMPDILQLIAATDEGKKLIALSIANTKTAGGKSFWKDVIKCAMSFIITRSS